MKYKIKEMIKKSGLTQKEIAEKMKIQQVTLSRWINGEKNPRLDNAYELSKILNCKIDEFIEESPPDNEEDEEIRHIISTFDEKQKKLILGIAKEISMIYNTDCCDKQQMRD